MGNHRFEGIGGEDYKLLIAAVPYYEELQKQVGDAVRAHFGNRQDIAVLDIGFGTGSTTKAIKEAVPGAVINAIEEDPSVIEHARETLDDYLSSHNVMLIQEEAGNYLHSESVNKYDAVASGLALHNIQRRYRQRIIKDIFRVIRSGGIFVNADKYAQDDEAEARKALEWQANQYREVFTARGRPDLIKQWTDHDEEDMQPDRIMRESAALKEVIMAGFSEIKMAYRKYMHAVMVAKKSG